MDANKESLGAVFGIFNKLSLQQRILIGGIFVVTIVLLGFVFLVFNEPSYTILYSQMEQGDASKVVEQLTSQKIPYKLEDNGRIIKVPKDRVYELRLSMASKGLPSSGIIGYEIFDKNTMGMSEFMQKLNFKRALEGELARTIMEQNGVLGARVHIVFPEKSIFRNDNKEPTASVVLKLSNSDVLNNQNIVAISNLVASSVEGLKSGKVSIIDTEGRLLSRQEDDNPLAMASGKQYEIKSEVENYLASKAQSILDNVVGFGNSVVKINVDLDFKQVEKTMESLDPASEVVMSEQTIKSESLGSSVSDTNNVHQENTTTNYEFSKSIERVVEGSGNINRITVAAVINGIPREVKEGEEVKTVVEPRPENDLQKLEQIIKQAVGFNNQRKDEISLVSIPFETHQQLDVPEEELSPMDEIEKYSNYVLVLVALLASMLVLKGLLKKLKNEKIMIGTLNYNDQSFPDLTPSFAVPPQQAAPPPAIANKPKLRKPMLDIGDIEDEITDEAQFKKMKHDKIVNYVGKNPSEAAKLVNTWLREDEY